MGKVIGIAVGAGFASALLFVVTATASLAALALAYLTPLPIMIAAMGFGHVSGGLAALVGGGAIALALGPVPGLTFLAVLGLPAWWLAYLVLLARPMPDKTVEWYPVWKTVLWVATLSAVPVMTVGLVLMLRYGGFDQAVSAMSSRLQAIFGSAKLPGNLSFADIVRAAPIAMAASTFLMLGFNLWLSGRVVLISQRLARPWPSLADGLKLPRPTAALFFVLLTGAFLFSEPVDIAAGVAGAALAMAFVGEGLATAHVLTRGLAARRAILSAIYAVVLLVPWSILALVLLGCLDCLFSLRGRASLPPSPTPI